VKNRYYACGNYIAKGRSACEFGAIPQEKLERTVIEAVLKFYRGRYQGEGGMDRLASAVREHLGHEAQDIAEARDRLDADRVRIEGIIAALLDNMTEESRDLIEERLGKLRMQREQLKSRSEELDRISVREAEVLDRIQELGEFIAGLEISLRQGINDKRMAALRRCIKIVRSKAGLDGMTLALHQIPGANVSGSTTGVNICFGGHQNQQTSN